MDTSAYESGDIRGAAGWNWQQDTLIRDIPARQAFEKLLSRSGISANTLVLLYYLLESVGDQARALVHVRSPQEYAGELPGYPAVRN